MPKRLNIKKNLLMVITLMIFSLLFTGCGGINGSFYTLTELYENESITRNDIMNIAGLRTGAVRIIADPTVAEWELEAVEFDIVEPESPLSSSIAKKIEKDFKATEEGKFTYFKMYYYGTYGDFVVVEIFYTIKDGITTQVITPIAVSDIYFGTKNAKSVLVAWRENS